MHDDLIDRLRAAEATYQRAHEYAEHVYRTEGKGSMHGTAVAARDRAESAVKSLRAEAYLVAAGIAAQAAADFKDLPGYLKRALVPVQGPYDEELGILPF